MVSYVRDTITMETYCDLTGSSDELRSAVRSSQQNITYYAFSIARAVSYTFQIM